MGKDFIISKKLVKWVFISLPVVLLAWFALCGKINVQAEDCANKFIDKRFPALHRAHELKTDSMAAVQAKQSSDVEEIKASVKILIILERGRMTFNEKQRLVDSLVKNDGLSYNAAYKIIDGR
jgi:glycyl-tRNA synthetase beta subunit